MSEASDEHGHVGFVKVAPDDGQHHLGEVIFGGIKVKVVQGKKYEQRHCTGALVAIDEGVVLHQVEQIGRGHLEDARVQELPAKGGRRHAKRGLEQFDIPDAGSATIAGTLVLRRLLSEQGLVVDRAVGVQSQYADEATGVGGSFTENRAPDWLA